MAVLWRSWRKNDSGKLRDRAVHSPAKLFVDDVIEKDKMHHIFVDKDTLACLHGNSVVKRFYFNSPA